MLLRAGRSLGVGPDAPGGRARVQGRRMRPRRALGDFLPVLPSVGDRGRSGDAVAPGRSRAGLSRSVRHRWAPTSDDMDRAHLLSVMPWLRPAFAGADLARHGGSGSFVAVEEQSSPGGDGTRARPRSAAAPTRRRRVRLEAPEEDVARILPRLRPVLEEKAAWLADREAALRGPDTASAPAERKVSKPVLTEAVARLLERQARAWREFTTGSFREWTQEPLVAAAMPLADGFPNVGPTKWVVCSWAPPVLPTQESGCAGGEGAKGGGAGVAADVAGPWGEPRTGVCHWEVSVMADGLAGASMLAERRRVHGTAAELLRDAERLGVGWMRQLDQADAHLQTLWKGCWVYSGLDAVDNYWRLASDDALAVLKPGWRCAPGTDAAAPSQWDPPPEPVACAALPAEDCPPPPGGPSCALPGGAPKVLAGPLLDLGDDALARGVAGTVPVLLGRSDRGVMGGGADPCVDSR